MDDMGKAKKRARCAAAAASVALAFGLAVGGCAGRAPAKVAVAVTENGFEPDQITGKAGKPLTLVVTRKTEMTCATEIVFEEQGIEKELPLNKPVEVTVTPAKAGDLTFACGMGMVKGKIVAR